MGSQKRQTILNDGAVPRSVLAVAIVLLFSIPLAGSQSQRLSTIRFEGLSRYLEKDIAAISGLQSGRPVSRYLRDFTDEINQRPSQFGLRGKTLRTVVSADVEVHTVDVTLEFSDKR